MSTGAQDWLVRTDVLLQSLSEMIVRYKHGGFLETIGTYGPILSTGEVEVASLSGKGLLYGGFLRASGSGATEDDAYLITLDGTSTQYHIFSSDRANYFFLPHVRPLFLIRYDLVNDVFIFAISPGITFETSLSIKYLCNKAGAFLSWRIHYATV